MKTLKYVLELSFVIGVALSLVAIMLLMMDFNPFKPGYKVIHNTSSFYLEQITPQDIQDAKELFAKDSKLNQITITNGRDTILNLNR